MAFNKILALVISVAISVCTFASCSNENDTDTNSKDSTSIETEDTTENNTEAESETTEGTEENTETTDKSLTAEESEAGFTDMFDNSGLCKFETADEIKSYLMENGVSNVFSASEVFSDSIVDYEDPLYNIDGAMAVWAEIALTFEEHPQTDDNGFYYLGYKAPTGEEGVVVFGSSDLSTQEDIDYYVAPGNTVRCICIATRPTEELKLKIEAGSDGKLNAGDYAVFMPLIIGWDGNGYYSMDPNFLLLGLPTAEELNEENSEESKESVESIEDNYSDITVVG